jgi:alkylated DNA repair dioxygenase AlkB
MRIVLAAGGWLDHEPAWLAGAEADRLLETLRAELQWEHRTIVLFGRPVLQPRLIAWGGDVGYRYSGQTLEPRPLVPVLGPLLARVAERAGTPFNHVLANRYRDGRDSIGFHADDETALGPDPVVATVSLGGTRRLVVKPRRRTAGAGVSLDLRHGSLVVMGGTCQRHYVHGVPRQPDVRDERISLTFRHVRRDLGNPALHGAPRGSHAAAP